MNKDKMREEFEELVVTGAILPDLLSFNVCYAKRKKMVSDCYFNGIYHNDILNCAYISFCFGWKASRESLALEFPDLNSQFISTTMKNKIINSIESQGIKVITK